MTAGSASVTITSRTKVNSSDSQSWARLPSPYPLGPLDQLVAPFIPVAVVFIYRQPPNHPPILPVYKLKDAMGRVLDYYPHLTGRLCIDPESGTHQINNLGSGAELLQAECQSELRDFTTHRDDDEDGEIQLLKFPRGGNDLLAPYEMDLESVSNGPVMTIQHTTFACGGVSLGIRVLHTISDAGGFFKFVSDLAEIYRSLSAVASSGKDGTVKLEVPPDTKPYLTDFVSTATPDQLIRAKQFKPTVYHLDPDPDPEQAKAKGEATEDQPESRSSTPKPDVMPSDVETPKVPVPAPAQAPAPVANTGRVLRFTHSDLIRIKSLATDPTPAHTPSTSSPEWISTFDALNAFLHQRIYIARHRLRLLHPHLPALTYPDLLSPVDIRRYILSPQYTGNAVFSTYASFSPSDLLTCPLYTLARSVHAMTRQSGVTDPGIIKSTIEWMAYHQTSSSGSKIGNGFRIGNASLMLSQWNKLDMYTLATFDRGVGPSLVAPPFTPISLLDGLGYYLPTPNRDGGIDVYLSLSDDVWSELDISVA